MTNGRTELIKTPCKNICVIDTETSECIGCGRTRQEISNWLTMNADERNHVMLQLDERMASLTKRKKRKGGARKRREDACPAVMKFPVIKP